MTRARPKAFRCDVISENVTIELKRRRAFGTSGALFVQCSEVDCQYVDANEPPCPLTLELFAAEIQERAAERSQ